MEQYAIYEGHMPDLMKKITRIQNKCRKYGCEFHFAEIGEEFREVEDPTTLHPLTGKPVTRTCRFVLVEAEGTAIINDWQFIASVEHTEKGNIFAKAMTAVEIPERYRTLNPTCEHCNSNRTRTYTFIVMNTVTGEFKMVGKSCLKDFTNGLSASAAAWFASLSAIFEEAEEEPIGSFGFRETYYDTFEVLCYAAETIRKFGYIKADYMKADCYMQSYDLANKSTKSRTLDFLLVGHGHTRGMLEKEINKIKRDMENVKFNHESTEVKEMAAAALSWIKDQKAANDYIHNLKVICDLPNTTMDHLGMLVSLFPTYNRELDIQAKKAAAEAKAKQEAMISKHIGKPGERITISVQSVKCLSSWESTYGYYPTTTYLYKIVDTEGNVFTWKTSNSIDEDNIPQTMVGTVKEHTEFRGVKQTVLTRCKLK